MKLRDGRRLIWDLETDGLLLELTRIHILVIRDIDTRETWVFRRNRREDNILDGVRMLSDAAMLIGHNIVGFDMEAVWKVYGDAFQPQGTVRDTMVMSRMLFADVKENDFRMWKREQLDGGYIGSHELGAWGQRLGMPKDDYSKRRKELAQTNWAEDGDGGPLHREFDNDLKAYIHEVTWGGWNQDMEDYAVIDVDVTEALWHKIEQKPWPDMAVRLEHRVHDMMERVQRNGFPFDRERARVLEVALHDDLDDKIKETTSHFGYWWVPEKWKQVNKQTTYTNPLTGKEEKDQPAFRPRPEFGEDGSRPYWGEVIVPSKTIRYKDGRGDREEGAAYCPIKRVDFNPGSRPQIIDRLKKIYDWEPQEFTEAGSPSVSDEILRDIGTTVPICIELAEIFYYKKRLGQLVDGKNGWLVKCEEWDGDGKIHGRINVGGTVTNRASHSNPNIAQVPRVVFKKLLQWQEPGVITRGGVGGKITYGIPLVDAQGREIDFNEKLTPLLGPDGKQIIGTPARPKKDEQTSDEDGGLLPGFIEIEGADGVFKADDGGKLITKKTLMKGRLGDHGWDCRDLFYVPPGWVLMGADQKGIELRCLGHFMAEFDKGDYGRLCVESDPHDLHQSVMELDSRDLAKTFIYAMIYGAQDFKLGTTIDPTLTLNVPKAKALGAEMRRRIMTRIPALGAVVKNVQREAKRGYVDGLDGRHLYVRARHAALNTKLQGAAATISKLWCVNFEDFCEEDGLRHGWDGDFAVLAWIHDELQVAVRDDAGIMERVRQNVNDAATDAGRAVKFRLPIDIDVKFGQRWADTH